MFHIRRAKPEDLRQVAEIYMTAFADSLRHLGASQMSPDAMEDVFRLCYHADPDGFLVAEDRGRVAGYVLCPRNVRAVWKMAVRGGWGIRMLWRWLTRRYRLSPHSVLRALRDMLAVHRAPSPRMPPCPARILSIAVHPDFQRRGIGRSLLAAALHSLRQRGADCVRLEVRPDNTPALRIYRRAGFQVVGKTRDSRGEWLVMVATINNEAKR